MMRTVSPAFAAVHALRVFQNGGDGAFGGLGVVAQEFGRAELFAQREPERIVAASPDPAPGLARFGLLRRHCGIEALDVDLHAALAQRIFGQIARETEGVVELEGDIARERVAGLEFRGRFVEQLQPARERFAKRVSSSFRFR
jgi:hypothetical protein